MLFVNIGKKLHLISFIWTLNISHVCILSQVNIFLYFEMTYKFTFTYLLKI